MGRNSWDRAESTTRAVYRKGVQLSVPSVHLKLAEERAEALAARRPRSDRAKAEAAGRRAELSFLKGQHCHPHLRVQPRELPLL